MVIYQGCSDLLLRDPEIISVFNLAVAGGFFSPWTLVLFYFSLNCVPTKIVELEYFHLYLLIITATKTSGGICLDRVCRSDNMRAILNYNIKPKGKDTGSSNKCQDLSSTQFSGCFTCFTLPQARMTCKRAEGTGIYKIFRLVPDVPLPTFQSQHLLWYAVWSHSFLKQ